MEFYVCKKHDLKPGDIREIKINNKKILLCCTEDSSFKALSASCPHEGAKMSGARELEGTTLCSSVGEYDYGRCNEIIRCPWHGYEFDVTNGKCLVDSQKLKLKTYRVFIKNNDVIIEL